MHNRYELEADERSGATLPVLTLTNASAPGNKRVVMLTFGEHGRELITSEIALWLVQARGRAGGHGGGGCWLLAAVYGACVCV